MDRPKTDEELTSTMGNVLSTSKEKNDSSDATPTSSTDASTNPAASQTVSDDPISSTSSDIFDPLKGNMDETDKAQTYDHVGDLLNVPATSEKITEDVEDLVHDLESLLEGTSNPVTPTIKDKRLGEGDAPAGESSKTIVEFNINEKLEEDANKTDPDNLSVGDDISPNKENVGNTETNTEEAVVDQPSCGQSKNEITINVSLEAETIDNKEEDRESTSSWEIVELSQVPDPESIVSSTPGPSGEPILAPITENNTGDISSSGDNAHSANITTETEESREAVSASVQGHLNDGLEIPSENVTSVNEEIKEATEEQNNLMQEESREAEPMPAASEKANETSSVSTEIEGNRQESKTEECENSSSVEITSSDKVNITGERLSTANIGPEKESSEEPVQESSDKTEGTTIDTDEVTGREGSDRTNKPIKPMEQSEDSSAKTTEEFATSSHQEETSSQEEMVTKNAETHETENDNLKISQTTEDKNIESSQQKENIKYVASDINPDQKTASQGDHLESSHQEDQEAESNKMELISATKKEDTEASEKKETLKAITSNSEVPEVKTLKTEISPVLQDEPVESYQQEGLKEDQEEEEKHNLKEIINTNTEVQELEATQQSFKDGKQEELLLQKSIEVSNPEVQKKTQPIGNLKETANSNLELQKEETATAKLTEDIEATKIEETIQKENIEEAAVSTIEKVQEAPAIETVHCESIEIKKTHPKESLKVTIISEAESNKTKDIEETIQQENLEADKYKLEENLEANKKETVQEENLEETSVTIQPEAQEVISDNIKIVSDTKKEDHETKEQEEAVVVSQPDIEATDNDTEIVPDTKTNQEETCQQKSAEEIAVHETNDSIEITKHEAVQENIVLSAVTEENIDIKAISSPEEKPLEFKEIEGLKELITVTSEHHKIENTDVKPNAEVLTNQELQETKSRDMKEIPITPHEKFKPIKQPQEKTLQQKNIEEVTEVTKSCDMEIASDEQGAPVRSTKQNFDVEINTESKTEDNSAKGADTASEIIDNENPVVTETEETQTLCERDQKNLDESAELNVRNNEELTTQAVEDTPQESSNDDLAVKLETTITEKTDIKMLNENSEKNNSEEAIIVENIVKENLETSIANDTESDGDNLKMEDETSVPKKLEKNDTEITVKDNEAIETPVSTYVDDIVILREDSKENEPNTIHSDAPVVTSDDTCKSDQLQESPIIIESEVQDSTTKEDIIEIQEDSKDEHLELTDTDVINTSIPEKTEESISEDSNKQPVTKDNNEPSSEDIAKKDLEVDESKEVDEVKQEQNNKSSSEDIPKKDLDKIADDTMQIEPVEFKTEEKLVDKSKDINEEENNKSNSEGIEMKDLDKKSKETVADVFEDVGEEKPAAQVIEDVSMQTETVEFKAEEEVVDKSKDINEEKEEEDNKSSPEGIVMKDLDNKADDTMQTETVEIKTEEVVDKSKDNSEAKEEENNEPVREDIAKQNLDKIADDTMQTKTTEFKAEEVTDKSKYINEEKEGESSELSPEDIVIKDLDKRADDTMQTETVEFKADDEVVDKIKDNNEAKEEQNSESSSEDIVIKNLDDVMQTETDIFDNSEDINEEIEEDNIEPRSKGILEKYLEQKVEDAKQTETADEEVIDITKDINETKEEENDKSSWKGILKKDLDKEADVNVQTETVDVKAESKTTDIIDSDTSQTSSEINDNKKSEIVKESLVSTNTVPNDDIEPVMAEMNKPEPDEEVTNNPSQPESVESVEEHIPAEIPETVKITSKEASKKEIKPKVRQPIELEFAPLQLSEDDSDDSDTVPRLALEADENINSPPEQEIDIPSEEMPQIEEILEGKQIFVQNVVAPIIETPDNLETILAVASLQNIDIPKCDENDRVVSEQERREMEALAKAVQSITDDSSRSYVENYMEPTIDSESIESHAISAEDIQLEQHNLDSISLIEEANLIEAAESQNIPLVEEVESPNEETVPIVEEVESPNKETVSIVKDVEQSSEETIPIIEDESQKAPQIEETESLPLVEESEYRNASIIEEDEPRNIPLIEEVESQNIPETESETTPIIEEPDETEETVTKSDTPVIQSSEIISVEEVSEEASVSEDKELQAVIEESEDKVPESITHTVEDSPAKDLESEVVETVSEVFEGTVAKESAAEPKETVAISSEAAVVEEPATKVIESVTETKEDIAVVSEAASDEEPSVKVIKSVTETKEAVAVGSETSDDDNPAAKVMKSVATVSKAAAIKKPAAEVIESVTESKETEANVPKAVGEEEPAAKVIEPVTETKKAVAIVSKVVNEEEPAAKVIEPVTENKETIAIVSVAVSEEEPAAKVIEPVTENKKAVAIVSEVVSEEEPTAKVIESVTESKEAVAIVSEAVSEEGPAAKVIESLTETKESVAIVSENVVSESATEVVKASESVNVLKESTIVEELKPSVSDTVNQMQESIEDTELIQIKTDDETITLSEENSTKVDVAKEPENPKIDKRNKSAKKRKSNSIEQIEVVDTTQEIDSEENLKKSTKKNVTQDSVVTSNDVSIPTKRSRVTRSNNKSKKHKGLDMEDSSESSKKEELDSTTVTNSPNSEVSESQISAPDTKEASTKIDVENVTINADSAPESSSSAKVNLNSVAELETSTERTASKVVGNDVNDISQSNSDKETIVATSNAIKIKSKGNEQIEVVDTTHEVDNGNNLTYFKNAVTDESPVTSNDVKHVKETRATRSNDKLKKHKREKYEELSINVDVPDKEKLYSPKVTIKPIKVPDEEVSTTTDSEINKGSLKMTITKQSDNMHSISKVIDQDEVEESIEKDEPIPKLIIKPKMQQVEQQHSPKMSTRSSRHSPTVSTQRATSPRIKIATKPEKQEPVSPLKIKINTKTNVKTVSKEEEPAVKKVHVKIVGKLPTEEPEQPQTRRITIKPIPKPDSDKDVNPKLTIKPIKKPEEDVENEEKEKSSPKITIKPVVRTQDSEPVPCEEETKERIVLKINKGNIPSPAKEAKKKEHPPDEEKLAKITLKFSKEGGHPHIVHQQDETTSKRPHEEVPIPSEKHKKQKFEAESAISTRSKNKDHHEYNEKLSPSAELKSKHKDQTHESPVETKRARKDNLSDKSKLLKDLDNPDDVMIFESKLDSPIIISEDSRSQDSSSIILLEDSNKEDSISSLDILKTPDSIRMTPKGLGSGEKSATPSPIPRKRGRPRKNALEAQDDVKPDESPKMKEPDASPQAAHESGRPKRSCRGQSVCDTLGIKPRKPRGALARGRGSKRGAGNKRLSDRGSLSPGPDEREQIILTTEPYTVDSGSKRVSLNDSAKEELSCSSEVIVIDDEDETKSKLTRLSLKRKVVDKEPEEKEEQVVKKIERRGRKKKQIDVEVDKVAVVEVEKIRINKDIEVIEIDSGDSQLSEKDSNVDRHKDVESTLKKTTLLKIRKSTDSESTEAVDSSPRRKINILRSPERVTERHLRSINLDSKIDPQQKLNLNKSDKDSESTSETKIVGDVAIEAEGILLKTILVEKTTVTAGKEILLDEEPAISFAALAPPAIPKDFSELGKSMRSTQIVSSTSKHSNPDIPSVSHTRVPSEVMIVDEDTRMSAETNSRAQTPAKQVVTSSDMVEESQSSVHSTTTTESGKTPSRPNKAPRLEVQDSDTGIVVPEILSEYYWNGNGPFMLQEQVAQFLGIKSFKRRYPGIMRRALDMQERDYIKEKGLASEHMCDLGLTAVNSADILDIMYSDFQEKYEEYCKNQRDKQAKELINKQKALSLEVGQEKFKADITEQAVHSAAQWNARFNKTRKEQRKACMDLQNLTVHYPKGRKVPPVSNPSPGNYPVALVPGQFGEYFKEFTPTELNNLPINTMCYDEVNYIPRSVSSDSSSEGSDSETDSSGSSSDSSSGSVSSSGLEDCKLCKHSPKKMPSSPVAAAVAK